jgi:glyoxylase-like metal-dependent hydrolase (beta-lactamase superfamily II)
VVSRVVANIFRIQVPVPGTPLGGSNAYVIKDWKRNLVVDPGLRGAEGMAVVQSGLTELGIDLERTDFFVTHLHADHVGLVPHFLKKTGRLYFSEEELDFVENRARWEELVTFARMNGFPEDDRARLSTDHPAFDLKWDWECRPRMVHDGDTICTGDRRFRCIKTPGHSKGHMSLYEPEKRVLISGDHLLASGSPHIQFAWVYNWQPLKEYMESLDRLRNLEIDLVLPGHGKVFANSKARIAEIEAKQKRKLDRIVEVLLLGELDAYQVRRRIRLAGKRNSGGPPSVFERIMALGETIALLTYLEARGVVKKRIENERITYCLPQK